MKPVWVLIPRRNVFALFAIILAQSARSLIPDGWDNTAAVTQLVVFAALGWYIYVFIRVPQTPTWTIEEDDQ